MVVFGSEVNVNPSWGDGVKGGFDDGVVVVTEIGAATFSTEVALKLEPLLNVRFLVMPVQ